MNSNLNNAELMNSEMVENLIAILKGDRDALKMEANITDRMRLQAWLRLAELFGVDFADQYWRNPDPISRNAAMLQQQRQEERDNRVGSQESVGGGTVNVPGAGSEITEEGNGYGAGSDAKVEEGYVEYLDPSASGSAADVENQKEQADGYADSLETAGGSFGGGPYPTENKKLDTVTNVSTILAPTKPSGEKVPEYNTDTGSGKLDNADDAVKNQGTGVNSESVPTGEGYEGYLAGQTGSINIPGAPKPNEKVPEYNTDTGSGKLDNADDAAKNQGTGVVAGSAETTGDGVKIPDVTSGSGVSDDVGNDPTAATGATGSTVTPGESVTGSGKETPTVPEEEKSEEEVFDEKMKTNKKIENLNIREGAMSYEDWMTAGGIDTQRDFNEAAKAAAQEYDRSLGTYGAQGEAMARAGLSGSGYSDYLTGNAYAARQRSMDAARQTKTLADNASRQGYLNYLENYENTQRGNIGSAVENLSKMGLTGDSAKNYLGMMGITGDYADYVVGVVDEMAADADKNIAGSLRAQAYADILNNGYMGDTALYYATQILGMDEASAKALIEQTDKMVDAAMKQAAAEQAAAEQAELADITVDVGSEEIYGWRSLMSALLGDWTNGAPAQVMISSTPALQLFPQSQRDSIITALYAITDDPGYATKEEGARSAAEKRAAYLINQISEYYAMEGYTEKQIEKILSYIEGGQ